jgi:hypothetical protein
MALQEDLRTDPDLESQIRSGLEAQRSPHHREVNKAIELDQGPLTPTEQETPGMQAAAAILGEPTAGHKADGSPRTGPAIPGRKSDTANPTWWLNRVFKRLHSLNQISSVLFALPLPSFAVQV